MAHLLAPIDVEGALRREAGGYRAGVILPLGTSVELPRILAQPCRSVLLGVDRDRHQVNPGRLRTELMLELLQRPAGERADRRARRKNEIQQHRPPVVELPRERNALAILAYQGDR